jgi:hypothetical protein
MDNAIVTNKDASDNSAKAALTQFSQLTPSKADYESLINTKSDAKSQLPPAFGAANDFNIVDNSKGFAPRQEKENPTRSAELFTPQPGDKVNHIKDRPEMSSPMTGIDKTKIDWKPNADDKINKIPQHVEDRFHPNIRYNTDAAQAAQQPSKKLSDGTNNIKQADRPEQIRPKTEPLSNGHGQALVDEILKKAAEPIIINQGRHK